MRILIGLWTYDYDWFIMTFGLHDTDISCTTLHVSAITCIIIYLSLDISIVYIFSVYFVITIWHWHSRYQIQIMYTESHIILHLYWLMKLIKLGLLGETVVENIHRGMLRRAAPPRALPHVFLCSWDLWAHQLLYVTWYLSTVNCFSLLSRSPNASLVWYAVVLWDGAYDGCIS